MRKRIGLIVGDAHLGVLTSALKFAIETAKTCDVIIVGDSGDFMSARIDGIHASMAEVLPQEKQSNPAFERPPIEIKNYRIEHDEYLKPHLLKEVTPWPQPKGRNGKRKW